MFRYISICLLIVVGILFSCDSVRNRDRNTWMYSNGKLKVLATTKMVADLIEKVGGSEVDVFCLIDGEHDPHSYQLVKGDNEKFARADIIFSSGIGLEHGPSLARSLQSSPKSYALGDMIMKVYPEKLLVTDQTSDPHIWMDVSLWKCTLPFIAEIFTENRPEKKEYFEHNAKIWQTSLENLHQEIVEKIQSIPPEKRYLVTTHDAFHYFTRAYLAMSEELEDSSWRIRCQAPEGLAPDSQMSTSDIQIIVEHIIKFHVHTVFSESNISTDSIKKVYDVVRKMGGHLTIAKEPLYADAMGPINSPASTYEGMMRYNADVIYKNLMK